MKRKTKHTSQNRKTQKSTKQSTKQSTYKLILGCHTSIGNGMLEGIKYAHSIGANAMQIFMGSNRSASLKTKHKFNDESEINEIKNYITQNKLCLIIHSIYLLNFCKYPPSSRGIQYMHQNIQYDLKYGQMMGAKCVVLHTGTSKGLEIDVAIKNMIDNVVHIVKNMPKGITLSLETSAGAGNMIGWNLEEFAKIWNGIHNKSTKGQIGICIDTAHIFVSGYDISTVEGISEYLKKFDSLIGLQYITNFHINDSKYVLGARKDEHRGIGEGLIYNTDKGKKALKYIKQLCIRKQIPMILETRGAARIDGEKGYEHDIEIIKKM